MPASTCASRPARARASPRPRPRRRGRRSPGSRFSRKQSVGVSMPAAPGTRPGSSTPAGTLTAAPSIVSSTVPRASRSSAAAGGSAMRGAGGGRRCGHGPRSRSRPPPCRQVRPAGCGSRLDRRRRRLAEAADRRVAHRLRRSRRAAPAPSSGEPIGRPAREPREQLLLAHGADPAGHALAARLVAEERGDPRERCRPGRRSRRTP